MALLHNNLLLSPLILLSELKLKKFMSYIKRKLTHLIIISGIVFITPNIATADIISSVISQTFQKHNSKFVCLTSRSSIADIRVKVEAQLERMRLGNKPNIIGVNSSPSANDIAKAIYTAFPCPFSPNRSELRSATRKDIEGVWLFPETSQKLKYGSKSPLWSKNASLPIKCESIAYYPGGESRHTQIAGKMECPFSKASDLDISRLNPKVASWKILENGMVKITRNDVKNHIEEWEIFTVIKPFEMYKIHFKQGDLLAYIRKENGNEFNVATQFRHLQKLN